MTTRKKATRGTEDQFNVLHRLVTEEFIARVKAGECSVQDLKAAAEWCIKNDVAAPAMEGSAIDALRQLLPTIELKDVQPRERSYAP
jgi:hypothetical protein